MKMGASCYLSLLLLLFLFNSTTVTNGYVVLSRQNTLYNPTAILDSESRKIVSAGFQFRPDHGEITTAGQADSQCVTSIGDIRGFDATTFDTPQMCIDVINFPIGSGIPYGVMAGMSGRQATLYELSFLEAYAGQPLLSPMNLPVETFPVGLASDSDGGIYVGLHDTFGKLIEKTDWKSELQHTLDYFDNTRQPGLAEVISPTVMKVNMTSSKVIWQTTLRTQNGQSTVGGIAFVPSRNILIVAGSSNGVGSTVGANVASATVDEWDGYVTLIDSTTGSIDDDSAALTHITADHSLRIQSQIGQNDYIHNVCVFEDKIYLVGSTTGIIDDDPTFDNDGPGGAFIIKLDLDTLNVLWKVQIRGDGVTAERCIAKSDVLFVAGHVPPNIVLKEDEDRSSKQPPRPTQDIMTAAIDSLSGDIQWVRQMDSKREDRISAIMIAASGNLFLQGNAYDFTTGTNKIYFMEIQLQGGIHDWLGLPDDADPIDGYAQNPTIDDIPEESSSSNGGNNIVTNEGEEGDDDDDDNKTTIIVIAVVVPVVLLVLVVLYAASCHGNNILSSLLSGRGRANTSDGPKRIKTSATTTNESIHHVEEGNNHTNDDEIGGGQMT